MIPRAVYFVPCLCGAAVALAAVPAPGERGTPRDEPRGTQVESRSPPPAVPAATPADPGAPLPPLPSIARPSLGMRRVTESTEPALPPTQFNPDPGAAFRSAPDSVVPFFKSLEVVAATPTDDQLLPADRALPRSPLERPILVVVPAIPASSDVSEPVPATLALPRSQVRENRYVPTAWSAPTSYPLASAGLGYPVNTRPVPDRWRSTGFVPWQRYAAGEPDEMPFFRVVPERWHYYRQSVLKGDLPIRGQDLFLSLTASSDVLTENRTLTVPSGAGPAAPGSLSRAARSHTQAMAGNLMFQAELSRGDTVFKPADWRLRVAVVTSFNRENSRVTGLYQPGPGASASAPTMADFAGTRRTTRTGSDVAFQEFFFERHLRDLSPNYDFYAVRIGHQRFNSDFRGLIYNDTNPGVRFFGNYDNNRWKYNAAVFDLREKDAFTELSTFSRRGQVVVIANAYREDFVLPGYAAQVSFHASFDQGSERFDPNGALLRPAPIGPARPHRIDSYYLGWAGDGHLGRWNLSHAAYAVFGRDGDNGLAGRPVDIFAQLATAEVSYDRDWLRYKGTILYASGDANPRDGRGTGFDSIIDRTNFGTGPFSYFGRQGFNLGGTGIALKRRNSLLPDLRTSKTQGQQAFVNPGLFLTGIGAEADLTPRLRAFANATVIHFATTAAIKSILGTNQVDAAFGTDVSVGLRWRPLLTENILVSAGYGRLLAARGFRDLHAASPLPGTGAVPAPANPTGERFLHSAIFALTLIY